VRFRVPTIEASDRELSYRNDQARAEQLDLAREVAAAALDLLARRHAVAAAFGSLAGKTPAHRGHVHAVTKLRFTEPQRREPPEHRLASGPRKRPTGRALAHTGCLSDQHHRRHDRLTGHHRADHLRAIGAAAELGHMALQLNQDRHRRTMP
jgi:hypothetical protein